MGGKYAIIHGRSGNVLNPRMGPNVRAAPKAPDLYMRKPLNDILPPQVAPEKGGVKESGTYVRRDSVAETITTDAVRACSEIAEVVSEYDLHREIHEAKIRRLLSLLSAPEINNLRYKLFAPHYDEHMADHETAIRLLLRQILPIERISSSSRPLIHHDVLDLSCGTGTIIKILGDILPKRRAKGLAITANDLSVDMKAIAKEKLLHFPGTIDFTGHDITALELGRQFGTIILSQTLHLITDAEVVCQERQANYLHVDSDRHFEAKYEALLKAWNHLKVGGTLIVIDEWPALLSDRGGPLGAGFAYLFNDSLREISYMDFSFSVMGQMPGSSLVAHLKAPIDSKHGMYVMIYKKSDWDRENPKLLPEEPSAALLRARAVRKTMSIFRAINSRFIDGFKVPDGDPWVRFRNMHPNNMLILGDNGIPDGKKNYSCVVIDRRLQQLSASGRHELLSAATKSLKVGGSLLVLDEWPSSPMHTNPISIQDLRTMYMKRHAKNLVYGGALRMPIHDKFDSGMFGFQFWRVM